MIFDSVSELKWKKLLEGCGRVVTAALYSCGQCDRFQWMGTRVLVFLRISNCVNASTPASRQSDVTWFEDRGDDGIFEDKCS